MMVAMRVAWVIALTAGCSFSKSLEGEDPDDPTGDASALVGEDAPGPVGDGGAGGGGAAGRIRLSSRSGAATIAGTLSPMAGTCTTEAKVMTR
jgi:hypothetical protein